ncbi:hypothetical protein LXD69_00565 [Flavobacterium sediminilitoris]|uniref:Methyltransferase n=1 Tax=Flavobacterium sediminilitoris TaxID=2024526 RepID=A0ABY4HP52_9FLAO|nr:MULTISPECIES: hypothetical protein [Flavobacterium]UOX34021.1 hypothetical protein LXD69_00565 [Flavobacterium sediminilitoris]
MIRKLIKKIKKLFVKNNESLLISKEIEWAHYYHDSIRGIDFIEKLNLNVGRWAGNYTFFYLLNRILKEYKPNSIIEFGLGESSKFISKYIENELKETQHLIIEQSLEWKKIFLERFNLSENSKVDICEVTQNNIKGFNVNSYSNIEKYCNQKFDLYIVDGPFGSIKYSRYDIVKMVKNFDVRDEFIIIMDDYDRKGEKETTVDLLELFKEKKIPVHISVYEGKKSVAIISTNKYKYTSSM